MLCLSKLTDPVGQGVKPKYSSRLERKEQNKSRWVLFHKNGVHV